MHRQQPGGTAAEAAGRSTAGRPRFRALKSAVACAVCGLVGLATFQPAAASTGHGPDAGSLVAATVSSLPTVSSAAPADSEAVLPADRDLLVKVRLAGLWEMPAGQMATQKGVNRRVREVGRMIHDQHGQLDTLVVRAANRLGVTLPDEPNADQRKWLGEMGAASGSQFDQIFVDRLRAAHGKVFPVIASVRAGTRNPVVREFAQRSNAFVLTHLTLLESTSLVDYAQLPPPPAPAVATSAAAAATSSPGSLGSFSPWYGWAVGGAAVLGVGLYLGRSIPRRRTPDPRSATVPRTVSRSSPPLTPTRAPSPFATSSTGSAPSPFAAPSPFPAPSRSTDYAEFTVSSVTREVSP